jgi:CrcB protein
MQLVLAIAGGGALGAALRHYMNNAITVWLGDSFPWGIFAINVLGSFVMGVLVALFAHVWEPTQEMKAFLTVGILGGFTTFSTFSLDAVTLLERGVPGAAALYAGGSVVVAVGALYTGMILVRVFTS